MPQPRLSEWQWLRKEVRPFLRVQIASLLLILTASFASLLDPLVMKWLIDDVLPNKRWEALLVAAVGFFVLYVGRTLIGSVGGLITFYATQRFAYTLRGRLVRRLQTLSPAFYSSQPTGDLLQRVENDVTMIVDMGGDVIPTILRMTIMTVMSLTAMLVLEWRLTFIVLPLLPFFLYLRHRFRTILRRVSEDVREASGQQTSLLNEILAGVIQIQLLGAERRTARRFSRLNLRTMRTNRVRRYNELLFSLASMSVISLGMTLVIGYGGIQVLRGELTTGGLVAFYSYIGMLFAPMSTAVELYARLNRVRASIHRIQDLEHMEDVIEDAPDAVPLGHLPQAIVCDRVSFAYDPHKAALQSFSVKVTRGERLALVGASGSGKTTVLKLMARLYDVEGGAISIDGIDVRKLTLRSVRDAIAFVPQDPVLFQGTMRENLLHARPDATAADLDRVAWMTCLTDVIQRLPGGWEATLGPMGAGLSGGERQRVAIARALLQDRPVLILDEATSALDSPTERRILAHLTNWGVDKIVLFVSHRMSAACWASRILVLEQGALVEQGGHDSLFHPGTRYFELWQRQPAEPDQAPSAPGSEPLPVF